MISPLNPMVTCPYQPSHRMPKSRLSFHLVKCSKQHRQMEKRRCPYDATHLIDPMEYDHHVSNCPNRGIWDSFVHVESHRERGMRLVDEVSSEASCTNSDEDWNGGTAFYDPLEAAKKKNVLIQSMCLSKKQRKEHKIAERKRIAKIEKYEVPKVTADLKYGKPLRAPKTAPKALMSDTESVENKSEDQDVSIDNLTSEFGNISTKDDDTSSSETKSSIKKEESKENIPEGKN